MPLHVRLQIAFRLPLNACVRMRNRPCLDRTIVLQLTMLYRSIIALTRVMQKDAVASIFGHGKPDRINQASSGNLRALASVADVAELSQLSLAGRAVLPARSA